MNNIIINSTENEISNKKNLLQNLKNTPIYEEEILQNIGLFITRQNLSRILCMHELYTKILDKHGIVCEFGVRWGQNLSLFTMFKGIYEPYNYNRLIVGFDTFNGFVNVDKNIDKNLQNGQYNISDNYDLYLKNILEYHKNNNPIPHVSETLIIKGDASIKIKDFLKENPHTIFSFVYFDFDIYQPTIDCLNAIKPHLAKGTLIGFDELNCKYFPGETQAFFEFFNINETTVYRTRYEPLVSYILYNE